MNTYTIMNGRLVSDVRVTQVGETEVAEARLADNPLKKKDKKGNEIKARFVTAKIWGGLAGQFGRLSKGDMVAVTGELGIETYKDSKTGEMRDKDVVKVTNFAVLKSESFFGGQPTEVDAADQADQSTDKLPF